MKYCSLSLLFLLTTIHAFCQADTSRITLPLLANKVTYTRSVALPDPINKDILFQNAQDWYKHNYQDADNTLTIMNAANGQLSGTGIIHNNSKERKVEAGDVFFTIDIIVSNGAYQYKVYRIYSMENGAKFYYSDMYNEDEYPLSKPKWPVAYRRTMLREMNSKITNMLSTLETDMPKVDLTK
jgi:hypothetical protein